MRVRRSGVRLRECEREKVNARIKETKHKVR